MAGVAALRPTLGLFRLGMRLNRQYAAVNVFVGFVLPLVIQGAFGQRMAADGRTRLLIGNAVFALLLVSMRKSAITFTADRVFGNRDLIATTGATRCAYVVASGLDAAALSLLPLAFLATGVLIGVAPSPVSAVWLWPWVAAGLAFFGLAVVLGGRYGTIPAVALATNLAAMGSLAFCPLVYPLENVPALVRPLVAWLPPSLASEALAAAWTRGDLDLVAVSGLAAWAALLLVWGARRFPWTDSD